MTDDVQCACNMVDVADNFHIVTRVLHMSIVVKPVAVSNVQVAGACSWSNRVWTDTNLCRDLEAII